jgi:DNA-binding PadR family transcriptional regulator
VQKISLTNISVSDISSVDIEFASRRIAMQRNLPDELRSLLPLTPAVFYVLFSLADGDKHGYAIMQETANLSGGKFHMGPGTLYTTLQRLLDLGLIGEVRRSGGSEQDNRRRYYQLASNGRQLLEVELGRMDAAVRLARRRKLVPGTAE